LRKLGREAVETNVVLDGLKVCRARHVRLDQVEEVLLGELDELIGSIFADKVGDVLWNVWDRGVGRGGHCLFPNLVPHLLEAAACWGYAVLADNDGHHECFGRLTGCCKSAQAGEAYDDPLEMHLGGLCDQEWLALVGSK